MNLRQATEILSLYRPGTADAFDPSFAEALALCERDPQLKRWFDEHCSLYAALRAKFKQTPVPEGLKEQILAERKVHSTAFWRKRPVVFVVVAATVAVLAGLVTLWLPPRENTGFSAYLPRMVSAALRSYGMDLATNDLAQIRAYCALRRANPDYVLPPALQKNAQPIGCAVLTWQGKPVTMLCFKSGKPLPPDQSSDLWLFVTQTDAAPGAPRSAFPTVTRVNRAATASWSTGGKTYVLVTDGTEEFLRKYL